MTAPLEQPFGENYAFFYDAIYSHKDYEAECDVLEEIFRRYTDERPRTILDVGCGTGTHAINLAKRGYSLNCIDSSAAMIECAQAKAQKMDVKLDLAVADMRVFDLSRTFDACISMFSVIDYIIDDSDLERTFNRIRAHLKRGALFVFDYWHAPAVLSIGPSIRKKIVNVGERTFERIANPTVDWTRRICHVTYSCKAFEGQKEVVRFEETHRLRFFFPEELEALLRQHGFEPLRMCSFLKLNKDLDNTSWNAMVIGRARNLQLH
jgi:SAM-dependent methyltransferase